MARLITIGDIFCNADWVTCVSTEDPDTAAQAAALMP